MIFLVEADDEYILQKEINKIIKKFLKTDNGLNVSTFDIQESLISDISGACLSNTFFDDKKIVIIENAYFLSKKKEKRKYNDEKYIEDLFKIFPKMSEENLVIFPLLDCAFNTSHKYLNGLKINYVVCKKIGHDFKDYGEEPINYDLYAKQIIEDLKIEIETDAYLKLKSYWLPLYEFKNEVIKLSNYSTKVNVETVDLLTPIPLGKSVFELTNALFDNKKDQALKIFKDLLTCNIEVVQIINTIASLCHFLYLVKYLYDKGKTAFEIADILDENVSRIRKNIPTANKSKLEGIRNVLAKLGNLDEGIKKGQITDPYYSFTNFILNFNLE